MKIRTKTEYNSVLKEIDTLLELSFLNQAQTLKLKGLLDALDDYQSSIIRKKNEAVADLVRDFILKGKIGLN